MSYENNTPPIENSQTAHEQNMTHIHGHPWCPPRHPPLPHQLNIFLKQKKNSGYAVLFVENQVIFL